MWEFCSNLNWDAISAIASIITAFATICAVCFAYKIGVSANEISTYATKRQIVEEMYLDFKVAEGILLSEGFSESGYSLNNEIGVILERLEEKAGLFKFKNLAQQFRNMNDDFKGVQSLALEEFSQVESEATLTKVAHFNDLKASFKNIRNFQEILK